MEVCVADPELGNHAWCETCEKEVESVIDMNGFTCAGCLKEALKELREATKQEQAQQKIGDDSQMDLVLQFERKGNGDDIEASYLMPKMSSREEMDQWVADTLAAEIIEWYGSHDFEDAFWGMRSARVVHVTVIKDYECNEDDTEHPDVVRCKESFDRLIREEEEKRERDSKEARRRQFERLKKEFADDS